MRHPILAGWVIFFFGPADKFQEALTKLMQTPTFQTRGSMQTLHRLVRGFLYLSASSFTEKWESPAANTTTPDAEIQ